MTISHSFPRSESRQKQGKRFDRTYPTPNDSKNASPHGHAFNPPTPAPNFSKRNRTFFVSPKPHTECIMTPGQSLKNIKEVSALPPSHPSSPSTTPPHDSSPPSHPVTAGTEPAISLLPATHMRIRIPEATPANSYTASQAIGLGLNKTTSCDRSL